MLTDKAQQKENLSPVQRWQTYFYCLPICGDTPLIRGDQYMHFGLRADSAVEIYHEMRMRALGKEN